jgi:hypothetical protein
MCYVGNHHELLHYLSSFGTRNQLFPPHPLNQLLDKICSHQRRTTRLASRGDPCYHHTCNLCGHTQYS